MSMIHMDATIVVVEDEAGILDLLREILEIDGHRVYGFTVPDIARIRTAAPDADLFLLDLMLPGMSGIELAGRLADSFPGCPMIAMSASATALAQAQRSASFREVLAKPFNLMALLSTVERCLAPAGVP